MRTYGFLRRRDVDRKKVASRFAGRDDAELLSAVHNPDHSAEGIEALRAILHDRGLSDAQIEAFRCSRDELSVPSFGERPSVEEARRRPRRWWAIYRAIQAISLALFVVGCRGQELKERHRQALINDLIAKGLVDGEEYFRIRRESRGLGIDELNKEVLKQTGAPTGGDDLGAVVDTAAMLACFLVFGPVRLLAWRSPARILLLRPFGTKHVSRALKRFIRRNVMFSGHVFTLADRYMKESLIAYLWSFVPTHPFHLLTLPLYPWVKYLRPRIYIKGARDFRALKKRLGRRWLLNSFWVNSWTSKIRKVRTVDRWWRRCIDLLAANCEVILVDLTVVKAGTLWELSKIREEQLAEKAIFVTQVQHREAAHEILGRFWPDEPRPIVHGYDAKGLLENPGDFANHLARVLALRPPRRGRGRRQARAFAPSPRRSSSPSVGSSW